jgi:hypothetical protein
MPEIIRDFHFEGRKIDNSYTELIKHIPIPIEIQQEQN